MALLFSHVRVSTPDGNEAEFLVAGIPREFEDVEGYTKLDEFLTEIDEDTEISFHAEAYLYGEVDAYYVEDSHPAIIDRATFEAAQTLRQERRPATADKVPEYATLKGKLKCGHCGGSFKQEKAYGERYWGCSTYSFDTSKCKVKKIPESEIFGAFVTLYNKLKLNKKVILQPIINQLVTLKNSLVAQNADFAGLDEKIMLINDQLALIAQLRQKGLMDEETFRTKSNELNNSLNSLSSL